MTFFVSCTRCTFEQQVETLATALDLEESHIKEWDDTHIIKIERYDYQTDTDSTKDEFPN